MWRVMIEFEFQEDPEDTRVRYVGDGEGDFAERAFERVRAEIESIVGPGRAFFSWYRVRPPRRGDG